MDRHGSRIFMGGGGGGGGGVVEGVQKIMCVQAHQEREGEAQIPLWLRSSFSFRILDASLVLSEP